MSAVTTPTHALSIRTPWVTAILHAGKRAENRSWRTSYRGPIYLHAARCVAPRPSRVECEQKCAALSITLSELPPIARGCLVATAEIIDCVLDVPPGQELWADEGAWHFVLDNVCRLETPIPARGALGIWRVDPRPVSYFAVADVAENRSSEVS